MSAFGAKRKLGRAAEPAASVENDPLRKWSVHCSGRNYADCVRPSAKLQDVIDGSIRRSLIPQGGPVPTQHQLQI